MKCNEEEIQPKIDLTQPNLPLISIKRGNTN